MLDEFNVTVTFDTEIVTTLNDDDEPLTPPLVAVMVALPAAIPCTRPLLDTVAIALFELAQVTARPVRTLPLASFNTAVA